MECQYFGLHNDSGALIMYSKVSQNICTFFRKLKHSSSQRPSDNFSELRQNFFFYTQIVIDLNYTKIHFF